MKAEKHVKKVLGEFGVRIQMITYNPVENRETLICIILYGHQNSLEGSIIFMVY